MIPDTVRTVELPRPIDPRRLLPTLDELARMTARHRRLDLSDRDRPTSTLTTSGVANYFAARDAEDMWYRLAEVLR